MQCKITRRAIVKSGFMASAIVPALGLIYDTAAQGADLPALDPKDPQAITLGFINDTAKVDAAANPTHTADQTCANCQQFQGNRTDARGGCALFPGKSVPARGWCKVWRKVF